MLVVRWSGFAVPPVLLSSEQLFTDRPGPVQSKVPVILIQCRTRSLLQADIHSLSEFDSAMYSSFLRVDALGLIEKRHLSHVQVT